MKVILNKDIAPLGEEGDVKDVAKGYARNYLFPRGIAVPFNERTVKLFESRKEEIDKRKEEKRKDAAGIKEKLEALTLEITMPAGANGKLYGAVTSQTIMDELVKHGHQIERKRIEISGSIKSVGKYKAAIKLYESASAEIAIVVIGQEIKTETKAGSAPARGGRRRRDAADTIANAASDDAAAESAAPPDETAAVPAEAETPPAAEAPAAE